MMASELSSTVVSSLHTAQAGHPKQDQPAMLIFFASRLPALAPPLQAFLQRNHGCFAACMTRGKLLFCLL
jgi:hypothetical protein